MIFLVPPLPLALPRVLTALALQVRRNVLDVSYHVSQYQNIISELREEIGRLKGKLEAGQDEGAANNGVPLSQEAKEEQEKNAERLKKIKNDLLDLFREQMSLRWVLGRPRPLACLLSVCLSGWCYFPVFLRFSFTHFPSCLSIPLCAYLSSCTRPLIFYHGRVKHPLPPAGTN